jgi:hypothetical protein
MTRSVHGKSGGLVQEVKNTGSLGLSTAPSKRSSLMKYLRVTYINNLVSNYYAHVVSDGYEWYLRDELIPENHTLDGKIRVFVVLECLSLIVGFLPLEHARESILPNLIMPGLNILINGPWLLNNLHVNHQSVVLDYL